MVSLKDYSDYWVSALKTIYDEREARNILVWTYEDVLGLKRASFLANQNELLEEEAQEQLGDVLMRLITGEPYQYIVGFTYFCDLKIEVSPSVLIPRPETEELVEWMKQELPADFSGRIEDWCTGSGCIALALKAAFEQSKVIGIDVSKDAIFRAKANAKQLNLDVEFDVHSALNDSPFSERLDVLVANPPYIPVDEREEMRGNVLDFEPELALFVPSDEALLFYTALGEQARKRLKKGGLLFFELHENYAHHTKEEMQRLGFKNIEVRNDLQGKPRMLKAVK